MKSINLLSVLSFMIGCQRASLNEVIKSYSNHNNDPNNSNNYSPVLTPVYSAMRNNLLSDNNNKLIKILNDRNDGTNFNNRFFVDRRNKRNSNEVDKSDYYYGDYRPKGFEEDWSLKPSTELICSPQTESKTGTQVFSVPIESSEHTSIIPAVLSIGKIILAIIGGLTLPFLILKAILFPLKIIFGLKAFALAKSILLGSLLLRYININNIFGNNDSENNTGAMNNFMPIDTEVEDNNDGTAGGVEGSETASSDFGDLGFQDVKRIFRVLKDKNKVKNSPK